MAGRTLNRTRPCNPSNRIDDRRPSSTSQSTRIQELADYGTKSQHRLPEDEGTGLIWRLLSLTRFEERDGGVYVEVEAVVLSRDTPASMRWFVSPIVRRVAKTSLITLLQETRNAVQSSVKQA